jgi:tetratricopeptide (TPR) repeat protein
MTDHVYYLHQGNEYYIMKKYDKAIESYTKSIEENETYKPYTNRSMAYFHLKVYKESLRDCTKAIRLSPNNSRLWGRLGATLNKIKKYDQSLQAYEKAIKLCDKNNEKNIYTNMIEYINFKKMYETFINNPNSIMNNMFTNMNKYISENPTIIDKMMDVNLHNELTKNPFAILDNKDLMDMFNKVTENKYQFS